VKWSGVKWSEVKWSEVKWSEVKWSEVKWSGVEWSEVKWRSLVECVLSWIYTYVVCMWVTVQYVLLLSHCCIVICFMSSAFCYVLINWFIFLNFSFHVCFLVLYVFLSVLSVLCFLIVLSTVSTHVHSCLFSICVQCYRPLQPVWNPTAVNTYQCCGVGWLLRVELSLVLNLKLMVVPSSDELVTLSLVVPKRVPTYVSVVI
jgi:hypothetical protein